MTYLEKFAEILKKNLLKNGFTESDWIPTENMDFNRSCATKSVIRLKKFGRNCCIIVTVGYQNKNSVRDACRFVLSLGDSITSDLPNGSEVPLWLCASDTAKGESKC